METYESLPVLLKIETEDDKIKIRLDENGLGFFNQNEKAIREISLSGCELNEDITNSFQNLVEDVFEYEVFEKDGKTVFQFWGDYGSMEDEILCESFTESFSKYAEADLTQKGVALSKLYADLNKKIFQLSSKSSGLRNILNFEVLNELERTKRKAEFFKDKEIAKFEVLQSEIRLLQKFQKILKEN